MTGHYDLPAMRGFGPIAVLGAILSLIMIPIVAFSVPWVVMKMALLFLFVAAGFVAVQLYRLHKWAMAVVFTVIAVVYNPLVLFDLAAVVAVPFAIVSALLFLDAAYLYRGMPPENHDDELPERLI